MPCVNAGFRVFILQNMSKNSKKFSFFIFKAFCLYVGVMGALNPSQAGTTWTCFLGLSALVKPYSPPTEIRVHAPHSQSEWANNPRTLESVMSILVGELPEYLKTLSKQVLIPKQISFLVDSRLQPLEASARYLSDDITTPLALFTQLEGGGSLAVVGHEVGHLIFTESLTRLWLKDVEAGADGPLSRRLLESLKSKVSDRDHMRKSMAELEVKYPALRTGDPEEILDVPADAFFKHQTMKGVLDLSPTLEDSKHLTPDLDNATYLKIFANHHMEGFSEVFADLMGAQFSRDPSFSLKIFKGAEADFRDFRLMDEVYSSKAPDEYKDEYLAGARNAILAGAPHLLHAFERPEIRRMFYTRFGREIGQDWNYDAKVAAAYLEALANTSLKVWVRAINPTPPKTAEATMALTLKEVKTEVQKDLLFKLKEISEIFERILAQEKAEQESREVNFMEELLRRLQLRKEELARKAEADADADEIEVEVEEIIEYKVHEIRDSARAEQVRPQRKERSHTRQQHREHGGSH